MYQAHWLVDQAKKIGIYFWSMKSDTIMQTFTNISLCYAKFIVQTIYVCNITVSLANIILGR